MSENEPLHFRLDMKWINFTEDENAGWRDAGRLHSILLPIQKRGFWNGPGQIEGLLKNKPLEVADLQDVAHKIASARAGTYNVASGDPKHPCRLKFVLNKTLLDLEIEFWAAPDDEKLSLDNINLVASEINNTVLQFGTIGSIFALRLLDFEYARPLPPRFDVRWPPSTLVYYASAAHFSKRVPDERAMLALLRDTPLSQGLIRRQYDDLLVIQATEKPEPREELARQLYRLEVWIGKTLNLNFDSDYQANGDQRFDIWAKEIVKPFSFYDSSTRAGYKVVAENRDDELDDETWKELEEVLPLRALPDDRPVAVTRVILVGREAALRHLPKIRELGGSGALYLGRDGSLWNPSPPGQWIPTNWDEV